MPEETVQQRIERIRNKVKTNQPAGQPQEQQPLSMEERIKQVRANVGIEKPTEQPAKEDGFLKSLIKEPINSLLVKPITRFSQAVGSAGIEAFGNEAQKEAADKLRRQDTEVNVPLLGKFNVEGVKSGAEGYKQAVGEGLEAGSYLVGGGGAGVAGKQVLGGSLRTAVKTGTKEAAKSGFAFGTGQALQEDKGVVESVGEGLKSAAIAAPIGAALPVAFAGAGKLASKVKKTVTAPSVRKAEQTALLRSKAPDARVATKQLQRGKLVDDPKASAAVKQNIPGADVALIKNSTRIDKSKMAKMLRIRESQSTNKRITDRATDVVGDTFMKQATHIAVKNKQAATSLNVVAQKLKGKRVNAAEPLQKFTENLRSKGITIPARGTKLKFKGSDFEGIGPVEKTIQRVWDRAVRAAKSGDALELHRLKTFIDENVSYGKSAEGLSGRAQGMLKSLRHDADTLLDNNFKVYNKVNTQFSDTIQQLDEITRAMGRSFKVGDTFSTMRAGTTLRRVLSNTQSRSDLLRLLDDMQKIAKKYGLEIDEDIVTQANFADLLENIMGSEAPSSFLGQIERGIGRAQDVASAGADLARSNFVSATLKGGNLALDAIRGITKENQLKALRGLLEVTTKKKSNLGTKR